MTLRIVVGEETEKVSKTAAEEALLAHPEFPKDTDYTISEANGRWVAAFVEAAKEESCETNEEKDETQKEATSDEGSESETENADEEKTAAGPADSDGPIDAGAPLEEPAPDEDPEEGPKDPESGLAAKVDHLTKAIEKIVDALGLNDKHDSSEDPEAGPPTDGPHPPSGGGSGVTNGKGQEIPKQKAIPQGALLKPGVSPPAFASVSDDHPWKEQIEARVASFDIEEEVEPELKVAQIVEELRPLVKDTGYRISSITDRIQDGVRIAEVTIAQEENQDESDK